MPPPPTKSMALPNAPRNLAQHGTTLLQSLPMGLPQLLRTSFRPVASLREQLRLEEEAAKAKGSSSSSMKAAQVAASAASVKGITPFKLPSVETIEGDNSDGAAAGASATEAFVALLAKELELGAGALGKWRAAYHNAHNWNARKEKAVGGGGGGEDVVFNTLLAKVCPSPTSSSSSASLSAAELSLLEKDRQFVKDAVMLGNCVISPFVALQQIPSPTSATNAGTVDENAASSSLLLAGTSTFVATRNIPAGVFLMSVPSDEVVSIGGAEEGMQALAAYHATLEARGLLPPAGDAKTGGGGGGGEADKSLPIGAFGGLTADDVRDGDAFFVPVEELAMHLAMGMNSGGASEGGAEDEEPSFFDRYVQYLLGTVQPPRNLPYMTECEVCDRSSAPPESSSSTAGTTMSSTAHALWAHHHRHRQQQPLNRAMFRQLLLDEPYEAQLAAYQSYYKQRAKRLSDRMAGGGDVNAVNDDDAHPNIIELSAVLPPLPEEALAEYEWLVAIALSRRLGASMLVPLLDKLNHCVPANVAAHADSGDDGNGNGSDVSGAATSDATAVEAAEGYTPNAYYTMATEDTFCGLDLFDNLVAGVSADRLYTPHVHLFSLKSIKKGEAVTLSYSDVDPTAKSVAAGAGADARGETASDDGDDGAALWRACWGFVPRDKPLIPEEDLATMASITAERRLLQRGVMFPGSSDAAH